MRASMVFPHGAEPEPALWAWVADAADPGPGPVAELRAEIERLLGERGIDGLAGLEARLRGAEGWEAGERLLATLPMRPGIRLAWLVRCSATLAPDLERRVGALGAEERTPAVEAALRRAIGARRELWLGEAAVQRIVAEHGFETVGSAEARLARRWLRLHRVEIRALDHLAGEIVRGERSDDGWGVGCGTPPSHNVLRDLFEHTLESLGCSWDIARGLNNSMHTHGWRPFTTDGWRRLAAEWPQAAVALLAALGAEAWPGLVRPDLTPLLGHPDREIRLAAMRVTRGLPCERGGGGR